MHDHCEVGVADKNSCWSKVGHRSGAAVQEPTPPEKRKAKKKWELRRTDEEQHSEGVKVQYVLNSPTGGLVIILDQFSKCREHN